MNEVQKVSLIEKGFVFDKNGIAVNHDICIKGVICSRLVCTQKVEIADSAVVNGDIIASEIIVKGSVKGNIYSKGVTKLCTSSKVCGKVFYGDLEIEKGAVLSGCSEKLVSGELDKFFKEVKTPATVAKPVKAEPKKKEEKKKEEPVVVAAPAEKPVEKIEEPIFK